MSVDSILAALHEAFERHKSANGVPASSERLEAREVPVDDLFVALPPDFIRPAVKVLVEQFGMRHLSTLTGQDTGSEIELLYHFWRDHGLTLRTSLPRDRPCIDTLVELIPGILFYELEVSEMLGVQFRGLPGPRALLLPDDWDEGAPLRQGPSRSPPESGME